MARETQERINTRPVNLSEPPNIPASSKKASIGKPGKLEHHTVQACRGHAYTRTAATVKQAREL